jgi:UDP-glucose:(heptosyl)LPS alpha-1,3-glucosyltransferase
MKHVVLLKSRSGNHGGLEKYADRIAKAFLSRGDRVTVLTTGVSSSQNGIDFCATKTAPWPAFLRMEQFDAFVCHWVEKNKPDLVFGMDRNRLQTHIRAGNGVHAAYLQSRILTEGKMKVLLCHMNPLHRKILSLEKCAFENPHLQKLFTNSQMVRMQVLERYRIDPAKIQVIHNGVEWMEMESPFLEWETKKKEALERFHLRADHFHFLFIGHGYLRKGLDRLFMGLSQLKRRDFTLSVIGKENQIERYRALAVQYQLQDNVRFFGPSQEISLFYQLADALVIPSFYDPFANVTVEALAMGLFVVSSRHNGGHEILTPQNGAIIEELLDPDAMAHALEIALTHRKTPRNARPIRDSVKHLDFSHQLQTLMDATCG